MWAREKGCGSNINVREPSGASAEDRAQALAAFPTPIHDCLSRAPADRTLSLIMSLSEARAHTDMGTELAGAKSARTCERKCEDWSVGALTGSMQTRSGAARPRCM